MPKTADREAFYRERDDRTNRLLGRSSLGNLPVHVAIDAPMATTATGQVLALSLINQLARVHRSISVDLPSAEIPMLATVPFRSSTLNHTINATVLAIDPYSDFELRCQARHSAAVHIGIGSPSAQCQVYLSCNGAVGRLETQPHPSDLTHPLSSWGAGVAACLGANAALALHLGQTVHTTTFSAWSFAGRAEAASGPNEAGPVDVGRVLMIGAGAVASGLAYWLSIYGLRGSWTIVDQDRVALHNTNRSLLFTPADSDCFGGTGRLKADVLKDHLPGSEVEPAWFDKAASAGSTDFDVVLCLANERDVRTRVAQRHAPIVLHATTNAWDCSLHRHICGLDDCIRCRTRDVRTPGFGCSSAAVQTTISDSSVDSALPFASAGAGLVLAASLLRLQRGKLHALPFNRLTWGFRPHARPQVSSHSCETGCPTLPNAEACGEIYRDTKWIHLVRVRAS